MEGWADGIGNKKDRIGKEREKEKMEEEKGGGEQEGRAQGAKLWNVQEKCRRGSYHQGPRNLHNILQHVTHNAHFQQADASAEREPLSADGAC